MDCLDPGAPEADKARMDNGHSGAAATKPICILVVGMHRSGTSAASRVLNLLGAKLPDRLIGAEPGNERGHWEPASVVTAHNEILAAAQSSWDDVFPLELSGVTPSLRSAFKSRLKRILAEEYGGHRLLLVKDPRASRLIPMWLELLDDVGLDARLALPLRNPSEVGQSLERRDGMDPAYAELLWARYMLEAEQFSRDRPRAIFEYEALLTEWRDVVASIAPVLGLPSTIDPVTAAAIDEFLTPELRHHRSSKADQSKAALPSVALRAYRALLDLVVAPAPPNKLALQSLDDLRAELDDHISERPAAFKPELLARRRHITGQAIRISAAEQERDFFKARSEALAADLLSAERRVNELGSEFTALAEARRSQDDRIRELEHLLSEAKVMAHEERQRLEGRVNELGSELTALAEAGRSRDDRIRELERILAEANREQQRDAAAAAQRVHALDQGIAERENRIAALSAALMHFRYAVDFFRQHSRHGLLRRPLIL